MRNYRITKRGVVHLVTWTRGSGTNDHIISTLCGRTDADAPFLSTPDEVTCKSCLKTAPRGRRHGTGVPKTSAESAMVTADATQDDLDAKQVATGFHAACGRPIKDHCAYCDTCVCGCPVADTIGATELAPWERELLAMSPGKVAGDTRVGIDEAYEAQDAAIAAEMGLHGECGKPLADHCTNCDECPRVAGPCWCLSTVDAEDDGRPVTDEPVTIVEMSRREAWSIVKRLEHAGVHVPDRLGMVDEVMSGVASYPRTPAEWRHVERCGPAGHCSCPLTVADVVDFMSPEDAVSLLHARERGWARRNKVARSRRRRYARKGH